MVNLATCPESVPRAEVAEEVVAAEAVDLEAVAAIEPATTATRLVIYQGSVHKVEVEEEEAVVVVATARVTTVVVRVICLVIALMTGVVVVAAVEVAAVELATSMLNNMFVELFQLFSWRLVFQSSLVFILCCFSEIYSSAVHSNTVRVESINYIHLRSSPGIARKIITQG